MISFRPLLTSRTSIINPHQNRLRNRVRVKRTYCFRVDYDSGWSGRPGRIRARILRSADGQDPEAQSPDKCEAGDRHPSVFVLESLIIGRTPRTYHETRTNTAATTVQ